MCWVGGVGIGIEMATHSIEERGALALIFSDTTPGGGRSDIAGSRFGRATESLFEKVVECMCLGSCGSDVMAVIGDVEITFFLL